MCSKGPEVQTLISPLDFSEIGYLLLPSQVTGPYMTRQWICPTDFSPLGKNKFFLLLKQECTFKHWIAFLRAIWIALERIANWMYRLHGAWKFAILSEANSYGPWTLTKCDSILYLHLFTTKFVVILLTLTQKYHISQISNIQKVTRLEQPADGWQIEQSCHVIQCKYYKQKIEIFKVWLS